jgi:hypothetical protein
MLPAKRIWKNYRCFYNMPRNRLYLLFAFGLMAGYGWMYWTLFAHKHYSAAFTPCVFKSVTGIACPSCGSTRAVSLIVNGQLTESILVNPLGIVVAAILLFFPLWLLYDLLLKKDSLYNSYKYFEQVLKIKWVAVIITGLILINWAWNINKGL